MPRIPSILELSPLPSSAFEVLSSSTKKYDPLGLGDMREGKMKPWSSFEILILDGEECISGYDEIVEGGEVQFCKLLTAIVFYSLLTLKNC